MNTYRDLYMQFVNGICNADRRNRNERLKFDAEMFTACELTAIYERRRKEFEPRMAYQEQEKVWQLSLNKK